MPNRLGWKRICSCVRFDEVERVADALPTGMTDLHRSIWISGWPLGRICKVFGPQSIRATTLLLHALAAAVRRHRGFDRYLVRSGAYLAD